MNRQDLRRLVTTFLVLAVLAASASLAVTSIARQRSEGPQAIARNESARRDTVPKIGDQALIETVPTGAVEGYDLAKEFSPSIEASDNFTDNLAKGIAYEIVSSNPEGPSLDTGIAPPNDLEAIMDEYVMEAALTPTTYAIDEARVKVARTYTEAQIDEYLGTLEEVFGAASSSRNIGGLIARAAGEPNDAAIQASNFLLADAQETLYDALVPAPAEKLHRSLLTYLELNRKLTDLDYTTDPLKAVVFAAKFPEFAALEHARVAEAADELEKNGPALFAGARDSFPIAAMLGIGTAHAFVFTDIKHTIVSVFNGMGITGTWTQMILEYVRRIATQILKNQIVGRMIQQTIRWVQGGGKPQFITNWKKFLGNVGKDAAGTVLTQLAPQLCSNFKTYTMNFVTNQTGLEERAQITCTLDQVVRNVTQFYDDFRNGSWEALFALLEPQNNAWGSLILSQEAVVTMVASNVTAQQQNAAANKGYEGMSRCVNYDIRTVPRVDANAQKTPGFVGLGPRGCFRQGGTQNQGSGPAYAACIQNPAGPGCDEILAGGPPVSASPNSEYCDVKVCRADGMQQTTPGGAVAAATEKALGASLDNIVNAEDLAGLIGVLVDSAINRLVGLAEKGIMGLFGGDDSASNRQSNANDPRSGGGTPDTGSESDQDIASVRSQSLQLVSTYQERADNAASTNAEWPALASSTRPLLVSVRLTCASLASDAEQRLGAIERIAPVVTTDGGEIDEVTDALDDAEDGIRAASSSVAISNIVSSLDDLNSRIANLMTRATTRTGQLQGLNEDAQANLADRACDTPLTTLDE